MSSQSDQPFTTRRLPETSPLPKARVEPGDAKERARVIANRRRAGTRYIPGAEPRNRRAKHGALFVLRHPRPRYRSGFSPGQRQRGFVRTLLASLLGSFGMMLLVLILGLGGGALAAWQYFSSDLPEITDIQLIDFQSTKIYDRRGELLYEISDPTLGKRTYVNLDEMPRDIVDATIAAEDATFYENEGVDFRSLIRAVWINISGQGSSGASTITMQLVRRVLLPEHDELSFRRKVREAILANRLTQEFSKDKILETYLNEIYYGSLAYGVAAAAEVYYGKSVKDLNLAESAMLAGLPQLPSYYDPHQNYKAAKARQGYVLEQMVANGYITQQQADEAATVDVHPVDRAETAPLNAPHFVNYVRGLLTDMYGVDAVNRGGLKVFTTLDLRYQNLAEQVAAAQIETLRSENASNAALVAMNPRTGEILAMLGSVDFNDPEFGQFNVALSPRQPGSAFKPIVYVTAFHKGMSPATLLADVPTTFSLGDGGPGYTPLDYDKLFRGPVLARRALANSLNIPTVELLQKTGIPDVHDTAHRMGITNLNNDPSTYGLSIGLGSAEVSLLDLTNVYATFANGGKRMPPVALLDVTDSNGNSLYHFNAQQVQGEQAISPQESYLITDILSDNQARSEVFGENSALRLSRTAAGKTGTTEDYKDSWTMGYTPALAVGAWVGNNDGTLMAQVAGSRGAGPIWHNFFEGVFANPDLEKVLLQAGETQVPQAFGVPPGLVRVQVCAVSGMALAPADTDVISELFIAGQTPQEACILHKMVKVDLSYNPPLLANPACPSQSVVERPYEVLPPQYDEWLKTHVLETAPPSVMAPCPLAPTITPTVYITPTEVPGIFTPGAIPIPSGQPTAAIPLPSPTLTPTIGPPTGTPTPAPPTPTGSVTPSATPTPSPFVPGDYFGSVVNIIAPAPGSLLPGEITVIGSANGPDFDHYELVAIDQGSGQQWTVGGSFGPVQDGGLATWITDALPEGRYILRLTAFNHNHDSRAYDVPVVIERTAPTAEFAYPVDGSQYQAQDRVFMEVNASGPNGILGVEFYVDGKRVGIDGTPPYQFNWRVDLGTHTLSAIAYSPGGLSGATRPVQIQVGPRPTPLPTRAPAFALVLPASGSVLTTTETTLLVQSELTAGVTRVDFYLDGVMFSSVEGIGIYQTTWQTVAGQHVLMAIGYDSLGVEVARSRSIVLVNR